MSALTIIVQLLYKQLGIYSPTQETPAQADKRISLYERYVNMFGETLTENAFRIWESDRR